MENYVTLFDSAFLPQGLTLHSSMEQHISEYTLWILCVDDEVHQILRDLHLPNVRLLQLTRLETDELLRVKLLRTKKEYCWTLTPFAPRLVFESDLSVDRVTYLDADLWFCKNPDPIYDEFDASGKEVLITDHAYSSEYDQSCFSGQFCVQFLIFTRKGGEIVRKWWEERCVEWCYARFEDGKFGDQKYLDDWPKQFSELVHILMNKELTLAPWNATRFPYGNAVFYHFHGLRITTKNSIDIGDYYIPLTLKKNMYQPYIISLRKSINLIERSGGTFIPQAKHPNFLRRCIRIIYRIKLYYLPILNILID